MHRVIPGRVGLRGEASECQIHSRNLRWNYRRRGCGLGCGCGNNLDLNRWESMTVAKESRPGDRREDSTGVLYAGTRSRVHREVFEALAIAWRYSAPGCPFNPIQQLSLSWCIAFIPLAVQIAYRQAGYCLRKVSLFLPSGPDTQAAQHQWQTSRSSARFPHRHAQKFSFIAKNLTPHLTRPPRLAFRRVRTSRLHTLSPTITTVRTP